MAEAEKKHGIVSIIKDALRYVTEIVASGIVPKMTEMVMKTIDQRLILIEKRILGKIYSLLIIGFGGVLLVFALLSFLIDQIGWSKAAAFFAIGMPVFVIGLLLKIAQSNR